MTSLFSKLALSNELVSNLTAMGFNTPTPIQQTAIPQILQGHDICACAQTGSGKTAAFLLPVIDKLINSRMRSNMPRAIVLSPTRELAQQVHENFKMFAKDLGLKAAVLVGGEWTGDQEKQLKKKPDLLIATPGRLLDLFERGKLLMLDVKTLVIDEADRMLDMGFMPDVERLLNCLPKDKQIILLSATFPKELQAHMDSILTDAKRIDASVSAKPVCTIAQYKVDVEVENKRIALRAILRDHPDMSAIVFCNRKKDVDIVAKSLTVHGFKSMPIHGDLSQSTRNETLDKFRNEKGLVLVASDVAARGIDIDDLPLVVNFDLPINAEDYIHRIGRTGRAGKKGLAFSLVTKRDKRILTSILKMTAMEQLENYAVSLDEPEKPREAPKSRHDLFDAEGQKIGTREPRESRTKEPRQNHRRDYDAESRFDSQVGFGDFVPKFILVDPRQYFEVHAKG